CFRQARTRLAIVPSAAPYFLPLGCLLRRLDAAIHVDRCGDSEPKTRAPAAERASVTIVESSIFDDAPLYQPSASGPLALDRGMAGQANLMERRRPRRPSSAAIGAWTLSECRRR